MNELRLRCWYVSEHRILELVDFGQQTDLRLALLTRSNAHAKAVIANELGRALLPYLDKIGVPSLGQAAGSDRLESGAVFTYRGNFVGKNFGDKNFGDKPDSPLSTLTSGALDVLGGKKLKLSFSRQGLVTDTAFSRLSGKSAVNLFVLCSVTTVGAQEVAAVPYVVGELVHALAILPVPLSAQLQIPLKWIGEFAALDYRWKPNAAAFESLRDVPEREVKRMICRMLGEHDIPNDWGGEECDLFSSNVTIDGEKRSAAFLLKGPARFHEMTLADCGKNADQIYRLFKTPADVFIVQHCHKISPAVRATVEAFAAAKMMQDVRYCFIDGFDTARIVKKNARPR